MKAIRYLASLVFASLTVFGAAQTQIDADLILTNANIFTGSEAQPHAEAIAIKGDRIIAVDTNEKVSALAGPQTRKIDAAGRLVIPGILDTHIHYMLMGVLPDVTNIDFGGPAPTCKHVLQTVAERVKNVQAGNLLFGFIGKDAFFDPECTPAALDRIAPNTAVFLAGGTVHAGMLNRAAAKWFGVDTSTPPPLAGWYGKNAKSKTWDGVVYNSAMLPLFVRVMSDGSKDDEKLRKYFLSEAKWGVTGNTFMEYNPATRVRQLSRVNEPFRVWVMPFAQYETGQKRRRLQQVTVPASIADRVTSHGEKWVLDGEPIHRTAPMRVPYADDPTTSGQNDYPDVEVRAILAEAVQHNLPLMIHVTADRSTDQLLSQMEATGGEKVWANRRLRVEHGNGIMEDLIPRAKKLGVVVAVNPIYTGDPLLSPQRAAVWTPCRSLLEAGVPLVLASDGGPGQPILNPFLNMQIATTYPRHPKEAITREQALIAFTRTAAYSMFAEDRLGTLEVGKQADLAVLSQDIFKVSDEDLPKTESVLTLVGGKIEYSREAGQKFESSPLR